MPADYQIETPQIGMRFVIRKIDGREVRILQQCWGVVTYTHRNFVPEPVDCVSVWRDVPCVTEEEANAGG